MDRLYFDSHALKVYSEDIENLQDNIQKEIVKSYKQTITNTTTSVIITGFNVSLNTDPTKIDITHDDTVGSFLSKSGYIVTDPNVHIAVSLADYTAGAVNIICAKRSIVYGSYDKINDIVIENVQKNTDFSNYALVYDRAVEKCDIVVYTQAQYSALTNTDDLCQIAKITIPVSGSFTIDTSNRVYTESRLTDGSITLSKLDPTIQIPQYNVDATSTGAINDNYTGTPNYLQDDLNRLRTEIKSIKGIQNWDDVSDTSLADLNPALYKIHLNGVYQNVDNELVAAIYTSTGTYPVAVPPVDNAANIEYVTIDTGKFLLNGRSIANYDKKYFELDAQRIFYITAEVLAYDPLRARPYSYALSKLDINASIDDASVVAQIETSPNVWDPVSPSSYTVTNGVVFVDTTSEIDNFESVRFNYTYGYKRFDAIDATVTSTGLVNIVYVPSPVYPPPNEPRNITPTPPAVTANSIRLCEIERVPFQASKIVDNRQFVPNLREITDVKPNRTAVPSGYDNVPFKINEATYLKADGTIDTNLSEWVISSKDSRSYATGTYENSALTFMAYTKDGDELYLRVSKTKNVVNLKIEIENTQNSGIFETSYLTIHSGVDIDDTPVPINYNFSAGYHRVKVTLLNTCLFKFWGAITGDAELQYTNHLDAIDNKYSLNSYVGNNLVVGSPNTNANNSISIPITSSFSGFGYFKNSLVVFNSENQTYLKYNIREQAWSQYSLPAGIDDGIYEFGSDIIVAAKKLTNTIYYSYDGENWNTITLPVIMSFSNIRVLNNAIYLFQNSLSSSYYVISSEFNTLESYALPEAQWWTNIEFLNGSYIVISDTRYCLSADGKTAWTAHDLINGSWKKIIKQDSFGRIIVVGDNSKILVSTDLTNWVAYPINISFFKDAVLIQDHLVVMQQNSTQYLRTFNFVDWNYLPLIESSNNTLMCGYNNSFYLVRLYGLYVHEYKLVNSSIFYGDIKVLGNLSIEGSMNSSACNLPGTNYVINGAFDIWSSNPPYTSVSSGATLADKWNIAFDGATLPNINVDRVYLSQTDISYIRGGILKCLKMDQTTYGSGSTFLKVYQNIKNLKQFQGRTLSLSFWAKTNLVEDKARFVVTGDTDTTTTGQTVAVFSSGDMILTSSWQKFRYTFEVPDFNGVTWGSFWETLSFLQIAVKYDSALGDFVNIPRQLYLTGFKAELGDLSTDYVRYLGTLDGELNATGTASYATFSITGATSSISPSTGALTTIGGVGVGESLNVNDNVTIGGDLNVSGTVGFIDTDNLLAADSDILVASQKATKSYVDSVKSIIVQHGFLPKSQCAIAGVKTNGYADFLTNASTSITIAAIGTPLLVAFADGMDEYGDRNWLYKRSSNITSAWAIGTNLSTNSTNYLYADLNTSIPASPVITFSATSIVPVYAYTPPSHASGKHFYNVTERVMYVSNGSSWSAVKRVFLGECLTGPATITSVTSYAFKGQYTSQPTALTSTAGYKYASTHNIGVSPEFLRSNLYVKNVVADLGFNPGDYTSLAEYNSYYCTDQTIIDRLNIGRSGGGSGKLVFHKTTGVAAGISNNSSWNYFYVVERTF